MGELDSRVKSVPEDFLDQVDPRAGLADRELQELPEARVRWD